MPPKRGRRQDQQPTERKKNARSKTEPYPKSVNHSTQLSPRRSDFQNLNRDALRRETQKRPGCGVTNSNKGIIKLLQEWDGKLAKAGGSKTPGNVPSEEDEDEFESMKLPQLREECRKRGLRPSNTKDATRKILRAAVIAQQGPLTAPSHQDTNPQSSEDPFEPMLMTQLRRECESRGLKASRTKAATIKRLRDHDAMAKSNASEQPTRSREKSTRSSEKPTRSTGPDEPELSEEQAPKTTANAETKGVSQPYRWAPRIDVGTIGGVFPAMSFWQRCVYGPHKDCLLRAFAATFYDNVDRWVDVRTHLRHWYDLATDTPGTLESKSRRDLYGLMNVNGLSVPQRAGLNAHFQEDRPRARYWATSEDIPWDGNLFTQILGHSHGDHAMVQVLADAFDVEIFMFGITDDGTFSLQTRGRFGSRQIFLANHVQGVHWTALIPRDPQPVTAHLTLDETVGFVSRNPVPDIQRPPRLERSAPPPVARGFSRRIAVPNNFRDYIDEGTTYGSDENRSPSLHRKDGHNERRQTSDRESEGGSNSTTSDSSDSGSRQREGRPPKSPTPQGSLKRRRQGENEEPEQPRKRGRTSAPQRHQQRGSEGGGITKAQHQYGTRQQTRQNRLLNPRPAATLRPAATQSSAELPWYGVQDLLPRRPLGELPGPHLLSPGKNYVEVFDSSSDTPPPAQRAQRAQRDTRTGGLPSPESPTGSDLHHPQPPIQHMRQEQAARRQTSHHRQSLQPIDMMQLHPAPRRRTRRPPLPNASDYFDSSQRPSTAAQSRSPSHHHPRPLQHLALPRHSFEGPRFLYAVDEPEPRHNLPPDFLEYEQSPEPPVDARPLPAAALQDRGGDAPSEAETDVHAGEWRARDAEAAARAARGEAADALEEPEDSEMSPTGQFMSRNDPDITLRR